MKKFKIKNYKLQILTALIFLLLFKINFAQTARDTGKYSFSLQQAIDFAMKSQLQVQNALYDEQIANEKVKETRGIGFPQINGSFDVKDFIDLPTSLIPAEFFGGPKGTYMGVKFGTQYNASAGINASQLVFSSDYLVGLQATKTYLELTRKATKRNKIETAVAVSKAYYSALVNEERKKLVDANVVRLKKLFDDTKVLNDNGFVEKIDLDRITIAYNNLLVEQEKIQRLLGLSNTLLKYQMGMDQIATLSLTDKLSEVTFQQSIAPDKFDYSQRIEYSLIQTQKNIAQLQLKRNKMSYLPYMFLYGNATANAYRAKFDIFNTKKGWYPTVLVGGTISLPIFDGLQKNYRIQQSKLEILKAENNLKFMQQSIDLELASSRINLQNASSTLEIQKKNIELAEEVYKVAKTKYEQGVGSNLEVLNAETSLKESQTNYFGAMYDALISKIDFDKATGSLVK
ncbi:MAG: TolC family protein [Bacteroidetes bacterium]|nr:TolC family protein [Bacteroidota bacterium]